MSVRGLLHSIRFSELTWLWVLLIAWIVYALYASYHEPSPYRAIEVSIDGPVLITAQTRVPVDVTVIRAKLCPYYIERRVYDATFDKPFDRREVFSTPDKLGREDFRASIEMEFTPEPGPAFYEVRVGSACNWIQWMFPQWTQWQTVDFEFIEKRQSRAPTAPAQ